MQSDTRRQEVLTGVTIVALVLAFVLVGEAAFRLLYWCQSGQLELGIQRQKSRYVTDDETGLRLFRPNQRVGKVHINSRGFRGPELPVEKPLHTFRLAFLGSSTTFDPRALEEKSWPRLLVDTLGDAVPSCRFDYINAGMPGYQLYEVSLLFEQRVDATEPDIVIVLPGGLRPALDQLAQEQGFEKRISSSAWSLGGRSLFLDKLQRLFSIVNHHRSTAPDQRKLSIDTSGMAAGFASDLAALLEQVARADRLVAVALMESKLSEGMSADKLASASPDILNRRPYIHLPDLIQLRKEMNQAIPGAVSAAGGVVLQGLSGQPEKARFFRDRVHFSSAGSRRMALLLANQLLDSEPMRSALEHRGCSPVG